MLWREEIVLVNHSRASDLRASAAPSAIGMTELNRLQEQLDELRARLSGDDQPTASVELDPVESLRLVREILRSRRRRNDVFGEELFGEPAWDLLLELYAAQLMQQRISVSSACIASAVPATTALRWIEKLEKEGWIGREGDPLDRRRYWVFLKDQGISAMRTYLERMAVRPTDTAR